MTDTLVLRLHDTVVGELRQGQDSSRVRLDIDSAYGASGVALTESFSVVPGTEPPTDRVSNFLGGYVPEGHHRMVMASRRGIDAGDLFALLREFGGSMAGAVTARAPSTQRAATSGRLEDLSDQHLADLLRQAVRDSDQAVPDDSRSTLPGFQPKVLVTRIDGVWAQPHGTTHSTYILKPQVPNRETRLVDEHYGHLLAQHAGLSEFTSELLEVDSVRFLAIERFDRHVGRGGTVELIHQEDAAQALGLDWRTADAKFQNHLRPDDPTRASAARVAAMLAQVPAGSAIVQDWVRRFVFGLVLGDNDAHAKNLALLHTEFGTSLAPAYDTVPNLFQREMIDEGFRLALAVNGSFDHRQVSIDSMVAEVESWATMTSRRAAALVESAVGAYAQAVEQVAEPAGISPGLADKLRWTVDQLNSGEPIGVSPWQKVVPTR